jgi:sigma-B regulation protein RsbU (phosphoserine phosphatase)
LKADRTVILLRDGQGELQTKAVSQTGRGLEEEIVVSRSIARLAVDQRQAIRTDDAQSDTRFREQQSVITQRIHSAMCVPLWHEGDVLGLIYVDNVAAPVPFEDTDLRLLTLIAHLTAVKVRETESWIAQQQQQQQLNQAADIQRALLPDAPIRVGSLDVAGANTPSQDVGGDYFDFITTSPERVIVGLGDVSGKGMPAALLMTFLNATVRAQVEAERPLADGMRHVNARIFQKVQGARFITLVLAEADGSTGEIRYVNAGHNPPFLLRRSGTIDQLTEGGLLLGIRDKEEYATGTCTLGPGEILLFYSDGVTEARNPAGEEFGEERLQEFLRKRATMGAEELTETLLAFVREFCAPAKPQDDVTVVVMHRP